MEMPLEKNAIEAVTLLSVVYLVITFVVPETQILLWLMALLIVFNYGLSLTYLFRQGKITVNITFLNIVQLALFCRLHALIYDLLGAGHYSYALPPYWYDWVELVAVHVLRAVDLLDALGAYGIHLQNVKHQSTLTGMALFSMHIMVDIFLLGTLFMLINRRSATKQASTLMNLQRFVERFKGTLDFLKRSRIWGLWVAIVLIITVGITNDWHLINWLLWPLDNILRTLDFGDAFQIFDWQLHSLEMGLWLATLAVFFRLVVGFYAFGPANRFFLYLLGGRGKTLEELARICTSPEFSEEEMEIAFKALLRFDDSSVIPHIVTVLVGGQLHFRRLAAETLEKKGTKAVTAVPHLVSALIDSDSDLRRAAHNALKKIDPQWQQSENAQSVTPHFVTALVDNDSNVRKAAHDALEKIDPQWRQSKDALGAIPHFVKALANNENDIQIAVVEVLGKIGPSAMTAIPHLVKALIDSSDSGVIRATAYALTKIEPQWPHNRNWAAISHLVKALANSDNNVRQAAVDVLEKIAPQWRQSKEAQSAIPHFVKALVNSDSDVRKAATDALEKVDPQWRQSEETQSAIPHFVKALAESNYYSERLAAANALGQIGPTAVKAIPHLVKALANSNNYVHKAAADALEKIDPQWRQSEETQSAIPHFVKALANSKSYVREAATDALEKIGPQWRQSEGIQSVIPHFVKALTESNSYSDQLVAANALKQIGPAAAKTIPHLVKALTNSNSGVRNVAVNALEKIYPQWRQSEWTQSAIPHFVKALAENNSFSNRLSAANALGEIGPTAIKAVPHLVKVLANDDSDVRKDVRNAAANALKKIDPPWRQNKEIHSVISYLVKALANNDDNIYVCKIAAEALGKIGPTAVKAVFHLVVKALINSNNGVRMAAVDALEKIDPQWRQSEWTQNTIFHFVKALAESNSYSNQLAAANALGQIGPIAVKAVPYLVKTLNSSIYSNVRKAAAYALGKIDPTAVKTVPHLVKALASSDNDVRKAAADALKKIDSKWPQNKGIQSAIPHLVKALSNSDNNFLRKAMADILGKIGSIAVKAVPHIVKALADSDSDVRKAAADALEKIDSQWRQNEGTQSVIPHFVKALAENHYIYIRKAAADALGQIGSTAVKAIPYLVKSLADSDSDVRKAVADALEKIDPQWRQSEGTQNAIPHLVKALAENDYYDDVQMDVVDTLGEIGPIAVKAVPHIVKILANNPDLNSDYFVNVRRAIEKSLNKIDPTGEWRKQL